MELTLHQQELLEFERRFPRYGAAKIQAVSEFFCLSMPEYERQVLAVLDLEAAHRYDSELVRTITRQRRALQWFSDRSAFVSWR